MRGRGIVQPEAGQKNRIQRCDSSTTLPTQTQRTTGPMWCAWFQEQVKSPNDSHHFLVREILRLDKGDSPLFKQRKQSKDSIERLADLQLLMFVI